MVIIGLDRDMPEIRIIRTFTGFKRHAHAGSFHLPHCILMKVSDIIQAFQDIGIGRVRDPRVEIDLFILLRIQDKLQDPFL